MQAIHRYLLLFTGTSLAFIGLAYCVDPNLLLARYGLSVAGASEDSMYRGAYGGLFLTLGAAIALGFFSEGFRRTATIIALLFMSGFAAGRLASVSALGLPHENVLGLLVFEIVTAALFGWFLFSQRTRVEQ